MRTEGGVRIGAPEAIGVTSGERERNSGEGETRREYGGTRPAAREMQKARATKRLAAREKMHRNKNAAKGGRKDTTKGKGTTKQRK